MSPLLHTKEFPHSIASLCFTFISSHLTPSPEAKQRRVQVIVSKPKNSERRQSRSFTTASAQTWPSFASEGNITFILPGSRQGSLSALEGDVTSLFQGCWLKTTEKRQSGTKCRQCLCSEDIQKRKRAWKAVSQRGPRPKSGMWLEEGGVVQGGTNGRLRRRARLFLHNSKNSSMYLLNDYYIPDPVLML